MGTTRKSATRKNKKTPTGVEPNLRHVWLASLGLLVAARREGKTAAGRAVARAEATAANVQDAVKRAEADLRGGIDSVRDQVRPKVVRLSSEVEARLAPVLDKLGLKPKQKRTVRKGRKPAAKKPTLRRAARKPAKRVARKAAR